MFPAPKAENEKLNIMLVEGCVVWILAQFMSPVSYVDYVLVSLSEKNGLDGATICKEC